MLMLGKVPPIIFICTFNIKHLYFSQEVILYILQNTKNNKKKPTIKSVILMCTTMK